MSQRKMIVTAALPYANGEIHLGHLVEYLQTDFWVRFQKMQGHKAAYICADDTHGTPIMIKARQLGVKPEEILSKAQKNHLKDFSGFNIHFDNYSNTNTSYNRDLSEEIFLKMESKGHIATKEIKQLYSEKDGMFLPDRFVKGTCPKCEADDQYGDSCDNCGSTYRPTELVNPVSALSGDTPVEKGTEHLFFQLNHFKDFLKQWVDEHTPTEIKNKLEEWLAEDLRDWDISRDEPYFGFGIPGHPGKYFYVWVDAPVGYMASTREWCEKNGENFDSIWREGDWEIYHFIGKDINYFHTLFWPAMLHNAGFKTPTQVFVHGFLTVNGEKMSKSKGTFINAKTYLKHLSPTYLRYYYACKMSATVDDIDLSLSDFSNRVNSDLVGKLTNLASRGAQMLQKRLDGKTGKLSEKGKTLWNKAIEAGETISQHFEDRNFHKVVLAIRECVDESNQYFDSVEPWKLIKENPEQTRSILTDILQVFRTLAIYLKPILPEYVEKVENLFQESPYQWADIHTSIEERELNDFERLLERMDEKKLEAIVEESRQDLKEKAKPKAKSHSPKQSETITFDDFLKVDLRMAEVLGCEAIAESNKLLRFTVKVDDTEKQILAGLKVHIENTSELIGKKILIVNNLAPRKMKFGTSEGMVLALENSEGKLMPLVSSADMPAGAKLS